MKTYALMAAALLLAGVGCTKAPITNFEECVAAGNPVMESYPRQCRADGTTFVETLEPEAVPPSVEPSVEPTTPRAEEAATGTDAVTLTKGGSHAFGNDLVLTLTAIEDSRCPKDVQCIWEGELAATLSAGRVAPGTKPVELRLGSVRMRTAEAFGWTVALEKIDETSVTVSATKTKE